ncbi:T9SS type A sorting domain-containing protein [Moheibacter sediminis]|uniref:Por secretion system C-terminal sorting domain-containing protein n=1 Tax=Moheibacter sediminis TaxID=1434700 RepID=A0A1W1Y7E3_9FLAO|nr:T9SS type A sorting domain-containing protein [Moheibacter sediminis]SMC32045.1 Por secretion system C-terminal sorting domain-containing protein [Moheibacter sediminis]
MKKILLLLFVPISLFAQFEDDYYILQSRGDGNEVSLKYVNISTNQIYSDSALNFIESDDGTSNPFDGGMVHSLTYSPETRSMFLITTNYIFRPMSGTNQDVQLVNKETGDCTFVFAAGGDSYFDDDSSGSFGLNINNDGKYVYIGLYSAWGNTNRKIIITDGTPGNSESFEIDNLGSNYFEEAMAYNVQNGLHYFIGKNTQNQNFLYSINTFSGEINTYPINTGNNQNLYILAMTFSTGLNKILIADTNSGKIFTLNLNGGNLDLYKETGLLNITGIVSVHDLLSNVEFENQGEIKIYPNPVKENLHLETSAQIEKIELFNIIGQKLKEFNLNSKTLNLSKESKGIYILKIQMKNGKVETKKIIKN